MPYFIGVDIGGTFTDCVATDEAGRIFHAKTLSTKADPAVGVLAGVELLAAEAGVGVDAFLGDAERLSHGTTIGTNLVVERKGATVGLVTTAGHGDCLLMMRGAGRVAGVPIEQVYSVHRTSKPVPLVPRQRIVEVHERVDNHGEVVVALDVAKAREAVRALLDAHPVDAVAISFLWSFANPVHEQQLAAIVREMAPDVFVSVSSEVAARLGEYERTVAAVINGYVGPATSGYLDATGEQLAARGLRTPFLVMQSNGGVVPAAVAKERPFTTIDSGPTGGLVGTAALAAAAGHSHVIATDMGGTSFDVGLVVDGEPLVAGERVIEQYTYQLPHLDVRSIACGGGSIARVDAHTRSLRVGPTSAGSEPGPACYGRGGTEPTVTDADVVLGLIRPEAFLGGAMPLDEAAARRAVGAVADELGLSVEEAAAGIVTVNNNNAALLIRQRTIEQGLDPRDFVLYAFGGAGPVHAFGYAAELGVREVVVPLGNGASTLSAYGIASCDVVRYFEGAGQVRAPFDIAALARLVDDVEGQARAAMPDAQLERTALMRYAEQYMQSLPVRIADGTVDGAVAQRLQDDFEAEYARLYGEGAKVVFQAPEVFAVRVRATVPLVFPHSASTEAPTAALDAAARIEQRPVYWPGVRTRLDTAVWDGRRLRSGNVVEGPALVELPHTTVAVGPAQSLRLDATGNLTLSL
jgi:N-methylhydantoinase A